MFKLVLEKAEEPEIKLPTSAGSWKMQESSRKTSISALLTMPKPLTVWITIKLGKILNAEVPGVSGPSMWPESSLSRVFLRQPPTGSLPQARANLRLPGCMADG